MSSEVRSLTYGGVLAALYVALTYAQNFLWPGSTSMMIQFRFSEALCVFAFLTPAAVPGLTVGCLLFNLSYAGALPFDWLVGTVATLLATACMWGLRRVKWHGLPVAGLLMPAVWNAPLVGWELAYFLGEGGFTWPFFGLNALYVFVGEAAVLLALGSVLYGALIRRGLDKKLMNG